MLIGKAGPARSALCRAEPDRIEIRSRDLCRDLMGRLTFTEFFFFLLTGRDATQQQRFFLDLLLIAIAEHGLTPTAQAARMTYAAAPDSLQGAVAAGILGCGPVVLGTAEACGALLARARSRVDAGEHIGAAVEALTDEVRRAGGRMPGFGHPLHRPLDPRAERILVLAAERGVAARHVELALRFREAVHKAWDRALPMNVSMPIAAVLLDLDFPADMLRAIPILARTGGLLAHLAEEQHRPIGFLMASHGEEAIAYDGGGEVA
ncbi:MAG TPA: citryl-CoA lyase [Propylenella sp.]